MEHHVYTAIAEVQSEMSTIGISKGRQNKQQGYAFRGIDDVYGALAPLLAKHGLVILPRVTSREVMERDTQRGGTLFYTVLMVEFDFVSAKDGSKHTVTTVGEAMDSGDKSSNKAMSAAYKYCCFQAFCIPTEGDNDADATTHDVAPRQEYAPQNRSTATSEPSDKQVQFLDKLLQSGSVTPEERAATMTRVSNNPTRAEYSKAIVGWKTEIDKRKGGWDHDDPTQDIPFGPPT